MTAWRERAIGVGAALALCAVVAVVSSASGAWMGARAVVSRPAVVVERAEQRDRQIVITVRSAASYPLRAEYGFALFDADGARLFESTPIEIERLLPGETRAIALAYPPGVADGDWTMTTWAREVIPYLERADSAPSSGLVESSAIVRRAPMSIARIAVTPPTDPADSTRIAVDLRLTGSTQEPVVLRYALGVARVVMQDNGAIAPVERITLTDFTTLTLTPGDARAFTESIAVFLAPGSYAVTLWVQRETAEAGIFEHFAQFTSPEIITIP
ncbi:MAG: hypothetical protein SGJ24_02760 [Chloroflexota bacterium]|nr:hypothetical protein [Chloroflexota bacterium]